MTCLMCSHQLDISNSGSGLNQRLLLALPLKFSRLRPKGRSEPKLDIFERDRDCELPELLLILRLALCDGENGKSDTGKEEFNKYSICLTFLS